MTMPADMAPSTRGELVLGVVLVVVGMDVFIIQPGFVQVMVETMRLTESEAGYVAAAEMFGIAVATVLMVPASSVLSWRALASAALALNALANAASLVAIPPEQLGVARAVVGLSSGVLIALGYALVGRARDPDRSFGGLIALVLVYSAVALYALPWLVARWGAAGMFSVLALFAVLAWPLSIRAPPRADATPAGGGAFGTGGPAGVWLLFAVFGYFLGQGLLWPYLAMIGGSGGASGDQVILALTLSQLLAIAGALTAASIGTPPRHAVLLCLGIGATLAPLLAFGTHPGASQFAVAVAVFNVAANFVTPLIMAIVARAHAPQLLVTAVAVQMIALAVGPALAAALVSPGRYAALVLAGAAAFVVALGTSLRGERLLQDRRPGAAATVGRAFGP